MPQHRRAKSLVFDRIRFTRTGIRFFYQVDGATYTYFSSYRDTRPTLDADSLYQAACHVGLSFLVDLAILALPETIVIKPIRLDAPAVSFWNEAYQQLAMERLYEDKLDTSLLHSQWVSDSSVRMKPRASVGTGTLLAMSGGKESLTALKLLDPIENLGLFFLQYEGTTWHHMSRSYTQLREQYPAMRIATYGYKVLEIIEGYGSSDYFAFVIGQLIFNALLYSDRYRNLVIGNEYSANFGNTIYQGRTVNHQYDKSFRFAQRANRYLRRYVNKRVQYFSPFFGLYEYQIAQLFLADSRYLDLWTSCNYSSSKANFCCNCVKCAFTYAICLPWTSKKVLNRVFGQDLLANLDIFRPLMDPEAVKPLDCVGEKEEIWLALYRIWSEGKDRRSPVIRYFVSEILPHIQARLPGIRKELESEHGGWGYLPEPFRDLTRRAVAMGCCPQVKGRRPKAAENRPAGSVPVLRAESIRSAAHKSSPRGRPG